MYQKIKVQNVISDCKNTVVKDKQIYKDKATFVFIMVKYAIDHRFNLKPSDLINNDIIMYYI